MSATEDREDQRRARDHEDDDVELVLRHRCSLVSKGLEVAADAGSKKETPTPAIPGRATNQPA
jgi:hypothetical protein